MTTSLHPGRASANGTKPASHTAISPAPRRQRSRPAAIGAALCAVVGMLGFIGIWAASSDRQPVLAVSRPVKAGEVITADDLAIASIAEDGALKPMPASARASAVGKTAAVDLSPGALLLEGQLGGASPVGDGEAVVAVEVPLAAAPIDSLHNGDRVQIIKTAKGGDPKEELGEVISEGRVLRVAPGSTSTGSSVVSLAVPQDRAATVAGASAAQRAALVVLPQGAN